MNKLRLLPVLIFGLLAVLVISCKKDNDKTSSGTGNTDLQVYVLDAAEQPITNASVSIYGSKSDRDAKTNLIKGGLTGTKGFVYFSELGLATYYVYVSKDFGNGVVKSDTADTGVPIKEKDQSAVTVILE